MVYDNLEASCRPDTWRILKNLKSNDDISWLILGDFNEILHPSEKCGVRDRPERQMMDFRYMLSTYEVQDLGFMGPPFTWCNNIEGHNRISERLDRFLANSSWCELFPYGRVTHGLVGYRPYHCEEKRCLTLYI